MPLSPLRPVDARPLFRPVSTALVALLRRLEPGDWQRTTIAGTWVVRDVVAHLVDGTFRRLSFHRDGMVPPPPERPIESEDDFVHFINTLNRTWVDVSRRFSPRVLTDLFERGSADAADWFEALPLEAPALFPVSWAGERHSDGWFDIGREFTELWHHQQQIRLAVDAPPLADPRYLHAVIDIAVRGLPHAYRNVAAAVGDTIVVDIRGPAGGTWTLVRAADGWVLHAGDEPAPAASISLDDDAAWKLLFNAMPGERAAAALRVEGAVHLSQPLIRARSVIV